VRFVDVNLLVYAHNEDAAQHHRVKRWLEDSLRGPETVGVSWTVIAGFVRLMTNRHMFATPLDLERVLQIVDDLLAHPNIQMLSPGEGHWRILRELIEAVGGAGNLTTDAHLAALAIENGAIMYSADADFARFRGLRWVDPTRTDSPEPESRRRARPARTPPPPGR
jgi:hypothetical protein